MIRPAAALPLLATLLAAACAGPGPAPRPLPPPSSEDAALRRACEAEAERAMIVRERGQEARLDRDLGQTDQTNLIPSIRQQSDAFNRRVQREELIRECIRANTAGPAPQDRSAPPRGRSN